MLFNSLIFLFVFLPIFILGWYALRSKNLKLLFLTVSSFLFYGYWDYRFVLLMFVSIIIDFWAGQKISFWKLKDENKIARKWMYVSIFSNLLILGFFKYFNFFIDSFEVFFPPDFLNTYKLDIILPVGISFYTFQSMSYSIDLYRGDAKKVRNLLHFSAYVSMFPQLIAGPIVRYKEVEKQFRNNKFYFNEIDFSRGIRLFTIGLFKKLVIADYFAAYSDIYFSKGVDPNFISSWIGSISYSFQIFFDFSAYSEMAVGLGLMLGFNLPQNFNRPYLAKSFSDFWRRWHITLSEFLRDNLYIPLGGNRKGKTRTYINLFLTMLLGGLWHGASWLFVIWGGLHGLYLIIEKRFNSFFNRLPKVFYSILVFLLVCIAWVFFRSPDLNFALKTVKAMLGFPFLCYELGNYEMFGLSLPLVFRYSGGLKYLIIIFSFLILIRVLPNTYTMEKIFRSRFGSVILGVVLAYLAFIVQKPSPFIYFQF